MTRIAASVAAFAMFAVAGAQAAIIGPGGAAFTPAGTPAASGVPQTAIQNSPYVTPTFSGSLFSAAYSNVAGNPFPGGWTFVYQITNAAGSQNSIERLTVNGFAGFLTDVTWSSTLPGLAPVAVDRSIGAGDVVGYFFGGFAPGYSTITPGSNSAFLLIHTNATAAQLNIASVIDGYTANVPAWAPVPTPGSGALLGIGLLASARRRRG